MRWAEEEVLGELQNGFRRGRCLEDNLFVLLQAIEIARKESRPLMLAFLDMSQAYDNIYQAKLWHILQDLKVPAEWLSMLQGLYADRAAVIQLGNLTTQPIEVTRGLW